MKSILFEMPKQGYEQLRITDLQQNAHKQTKIDSFFRPKTPTPPTTPIQSPGPSQTSFRPIESDSESDSE